MNKNYSTNGSQPIHMILLMQFVCVILACMCTDEWHPTASTLPSQSSSQKAYAGVKYYTTAVTLKQSSKGPFPENFLCY